jgi:tetratricopeptide (TPR) repeat protein
MEPERLRALLDAERDAVRGLSEYETAEELGVAIRRVSAAVERVFRLLLRAEPAAPDSARLAALSDELPVEEVVVALRRADTITMELAGVFAQLREAAGRARDGAVTAADGDLARSLLHMLEAVIPDPGRPAAQPPARVVTDGPPVARRGSGRGLLYVAGAILVAGAVWVALRDRSPGADAGVEAFAAGRLVEAEGVFRERVESGAAGVTDWLYLGRIQRRAGRHIDAAASLRTAADMAPEDDDVRRELGWLFLDLEQPGAAAGQFRQAVEIDSVEPDNWIGLIHALRAAGDPAAENWLARAPREARTRFAAGTDDDASR